MQFGFLPKGLRKVKFGICVTVLELTPQNTNLLIVATDQKNIYKKKGLAFNMETFQYILKIY